MTPMRPLYGINEKIRDLIRVDGFIKSHVWHFAKSMPEIPHWYCLLKDKGDVEEFRWFANYIREHSEPGQFYGKTYYYYYHGGFKFWMMDEFPDQCDLINRDIVDGEAPIVFPHFSLIVTGSLERVLDIFRQNNMPLQKGDFYEDKGYVFMTRAGSENEKALLLALDNCPDVTAVSSMYGQGIKEYIEFCKNSIVPVTVGFDLYGI